jgi:hypothetical protein
MINYKFYKSEDDFRIAADKPYELIGYFSIGKNWTSSEISSILDSLQKVKNAEIPEYWMQTQSGFLAGAIQTLEGQTDYPNAMVDVYYDFGDNPSEPVFRIALDEFTQLLTDFKDFLEKNKR